MSLEIIAYPTAKAMSAALDGQAGGISLQGRFIGVGKGLQSIALDDAGRAITDRLSAPIAWLEILSAKRVSPYQWQLTIDAAGTNDGVEYNLGEIALSGAVDVADANDDVIAIYSNENQAMMTMSPQVDHALVGINLIFATMPANSVEIVHLNLPLELSVASEMASIMVSVGEMAVSARESLQAESELRTKDELQQSELSEQSERIASQGQHIAALEAWREGVDRTLLEQVNFNASTHRAVGELANP